MIVRMHQDEILDILNDHVEGRYWTFQLVKSKLHVNVDPPTVWLDVELEET